MQPADASEALHDAPKQFTLQQAIETALADNPEGDMALARIQKAESMIDMSRSPFLPSFSFYTEYLQGDAPSAYLFKTIDTRKYEPTDFNNPGWFQNYETGITAKWNLYNSGKDSLQKKMAQSGRSIRDLDKQQIENAIIASVIHTYYNGLVARAFIRISEESVTTVKEQLRIMQVRYKAGGALKSDVLSLEVRLAQVREDLVRSRNNLEIALAALAMVMGMSPDVSIDISAEEIHSFALPDGYADGVVYAMENRPELKKIREQVRQSQLAGQLARAGYLPRVDALGKYYFDDPKMDYDMDRVNWTVAVLLNWELFSGFSTQASQKKATAQLAEVMAANRKTILAVKLDVKKAYLNINAAAARLEVAQASVKRAEESLGLVKKQYEGGSATITRYLEAELARNHAMISATSAYYDREKALAEAARVLGMLHQTF